MRCTALYDNTVCVCVQVLFGTFTHSEVLDLYSTESSDLEVTPHKHTHTHTHTHTSPRLSLHTPPPPPVQMAGEEDALSSQHPPRHSRETHSQELHSGCRLTQPASQPAHHSRVWVSGGQPQSPVPTQRPGSPVHPRFQSRATLSPE